MVDAQGYGRFRSGSLDDYWDLGTALYHEPKIDPIGHCHYPYFWWIDCYCRSQFEKSAKKAQEELGQNTSALEEVLTNLAIIKAFVAEEAMSKRYEQSLSAWTAHMVSVFRKRDLSSPIAEVLGVSVLLVVLYLGGMEVIAGRSLTGGELIAFVVLFYQLIPAFKNVTNALYDIQKGNASAARVFEVLDMEEAKNGSLAPKDSQWQEDIKFSGVQFAYDEHPIINQLDLTIPAGKTTAIVGPSGSGNTTLLHLLAGFAHPQQGAISLGPQSTDAELKAYRRNLGGSAATVVVQYLICWERGLGQYTRPK